MTFDWNQIILNLVTGLASGGLSALITYQLAFRRFRAEKWWEQRAVAYTSIVEALHNSLRFSDTHLDYMQKGKEVAPELDTTVRDAARTGHNEILRAINVGKLFLSSATLNRLARYVKESDAVKTEYWIDYLEKDYELTSTCLDEFAQLARKDLGTDR